MKSNRTLKCGSGGCLRPVKKSCDLWMPLVAGLFLSVVIIISWGIPDVISVSKKAERAMFSLDTLRQQLINIQRIELHSLAPQSSPLINQLTTANAENQIILDQLKQNVAYNADLSKGIVQFSKVYQTWIDKKYILHNDRIMDYSHFMEHANSGELFLSAMTLLYECEQLIHTQMFNGKTALKNIGWILLTLIAYIAITALLYQRKASRKIKIQEKQLNTTLESVADAVITTNLQGQVMCINLGGEKMTNLSKDEAVGKPLALLFESITIRDDERQIEEQLKGNIVGFSDDVLLTTTNDNHYKVVNSGASICDDEGNITGVIHIFKNVTHEYELQGKLIKQAKHLQQTIGSVLDAVIVTDERGTILEWNKRAEEIFGWSYKEIITQSMHGLIVPLKYHDQPFQSIQKLIDVDLEPGRQGHLKTKGIHKKGHIFSIEIWVTSIQHADGDQYFCVCIRDLIDIEGIRQELASNKKIFVES